MSSVTARSADRPLGELRWDGGRLIIKTGAYGSLRSSSVLRVELTVEHYDGSEHYDDSETRVERRFTLSETPCSGVSVTVITASLTSDDPRPHETYRPRRQEHPRRTLRPRQHNH
jgi:hypothetical protein